MRRPVWVAIAAGVTSVLYACSDQAPTSPTPSSIRSGPLATRDADGTPPPQAFAHEAEFHRLAAQLPEFGGYYYNDAGDLIAYVKDVAQRGQAARALLSAAANAPTRGRRDRGSGPRKIVLRAGRRPKRS